MELVGCKELASDTFLQRREMGVINIGGKGKITVDGTVYDLKQYDGLYVGMGAKELSFTSDDPADPAKFYINTCPAHKTYPTVKIDIDKANKRPLGSVETCNKRVINQYIHPAVMQSCQLCMGHDPARAGQQLELHALPHARAPHGGLFLLRSQG